MVSAPGSAAAGLAFNFTVTAQDLFGNTAPVSRTVHFTSTDGAAVLPVNSSLIDGVRTFSAALVTTGSQTITATDAVLSGTDQRNQRLPSSLVREQPRTSASPLPGRLLLATASPSRSPRSTSSAIRLRDTGTVHFTSTDGSATLPADSELTTSGVGTFSATLNTAGGQKIAASDTAISQTNGISGTVVVGSAAATHLSVVCVTSATAGTQFNVTVTAFDQFGNVATGYGGTVHFTSTDALAVLPANTTLTNGVKTVASTLKTTANLATITATDTVTGSISGASGQILVLTGGATHFSVITPSVEPSGTSIALRVTALDQFNNVVAGYTGVVHFTSTDGAASLPEDTSLTNGVGNLSATLTTVGTQTITATDTVSAGVHGSSTIHVGAASAVHLVVSAPSTATAGASFLFTVTAKDSLGNTVTGYSRTVKFGSSDGHASLPSPTTLTNGTGTFTGTILLAGNQTITAIDTVTTSTVGISGVNRRQPGRGQRTPGLLLPGSRLPLDHHSTSAWTPSTSTATWRPGIPARFTLSAPTPGATLPRTSPSRTGWGASMRPSKERRSTDYGIRHPE